jgi:hypothetical protein
LMFVDAGYQGRVSNSGTLLWTMNCIKAWQQ